MDRLIECRQIESLLPPYVDGEAPASDAARVEAHLATCAVCRDSVAAERAARRVVQATAARLATPAPPGLRTRIAALAADVATPSRGWRGRVAAFASAAALVVLLVFASELVTPQSNVLYAAQLAIDHVRCFIVHLGSVDATRPEAVHAEFADRYGWDVRVPASSHEVGLTLVAARRCPFWLGDRAHLLYRRGDREVSLYITQGPARADQQLHLFGYVERIWTANGSTYALVAGGLPAGELARIASYLERETRANTH